MADASAVPAGFRRVTASGVAALAVIVAACEGTTLVINSGAGLVGLSSSPSALTASVGLQPGFVPPACVPDTPYVVPVKVDVVTTRSIEIQSMTLALIDGSNLGGPTVTIPSERLTAQFGSMCIPAGGRRTFGVQPQFGCAAAPWTIRVTIVVVDGAGSVQQVTASGPG